MNKKTNLSGLSAVLLFVMTLLSPAAWAGLPFFDSQGDKLPTLAPMLEKTTPAVVNIATTGTVRVQENPLFSDPFFRHFFGDRFPNQPRERKTSSLGSGVIVDAKKGYIMTNHHVIAKADEITVTLRDGRSLKAKLIGTDPDTDIAVIQVPAENLTAVPFADSEALRVGDFVVAIGNPFGLGQTVTSGIVSALSRSGLGIEGYEDFIQTDASINPGNSGGALVNLRGELVGINTAIFSQNGGNVGIGFAIPINMAESIMQQLIEHGEVKRGRLGAQAQNLTPDLAQAFNLQQGRGAVITRVSTGSPADKAGLQAGDIVTEINGKQVRNADSLRNTIGLLRVGEKVTLQILREGKSKKLVVEIKEAVIETTQGEQVHRYLAGATLTDIEDDSRRHGRIAGVLVTEVERGSPAWRAGIRPNDVITAVNRKPVKNVQAMQKLLGKSRGLQLHLRRGGDTLFLYLQ
ncbi:MAG: DegQ family serine endoprotease [Gammaproteobacteria bacterium]|nr:DegQ family serine endoprotease [Gammaproteobacteria bacterium]MDH5651790.1 DegQ family serine endoprotease [Gammaproteobacteria bacterium]